MPRRQAPRISAWRADPEGTERRDRVTMLLAALLLLLPPLPDPRSAHGHPLYMRVPPSTLQGELARGRGRGLRHGALSSPSPLTGPFGPFCAPVAPLCWQKGRELRHRWERKGETEAG